MTRPEMRPETRPEMRRSERGFTLIELMVALVVSSLLVGMILAIFNRMSMAYRGQQQIAGVQQVLAAARATIELDAKQAGLELSQGFRYAADSGTPPVARSPVRVTDNLTGMGPDQIAFFYGDPTTQAAVTGGTMPTINVDATTGFAVGDLVVLSRVDTTTGGVNPGVDANLATYEACVLKVTVVTASPARLTFDTAAPWGRTGETHCTMALSSPTMVYKFVAHAYRIDTSTTTLAAQGPLQLSPTGALVGTVAGDAWAPLAYGFTDIQTALQVYDHTSAPGDTADADADGDRDWFSDATQTTLTGPSTTLTGTDGLLQMSISLVARTDRPVEGIATAATPNLTDPTAPNNNTLGNHASVSLPSATDPALGGSYVYRFTTFTVDLRNLGVGR